MSHRSPHWVGIDWGTTHRRAWHFAHGERVALHADDQGVLACAPRFAESLQALLQRLAAPADSTVVMAGMVGSATGWQEVPYLDAAHPVTAWSRRLVAVDGAAQCFIVPGCCWQRGDEIDVMRGEETQLLGAWVLAPNDGWYVLPGTHSKWVELRDGCVVQLRTCMSGELFALLSSHGTLAPLMRPIPGDDPLAHPLAFEQGVRAAQRRALSRELFGCRARVVTGRLQREAAGAYLSGLLLGTEWHEALANGLPRDAAVRLIGSPALTRLHAHCAQLLGATAVTLDVDAVQTAAWRALGACSTEALA
jgi:2-dehydro-3-deoxygalactonokinase